MSPHQGSLQTARLHAWCAELAGLLAESSVATVELVDANSQSRVLEARVTDLAGELARAAPCTLVLPPPINLTVRLFADRIEWTCAEHPLAEALRAIRV